MKTYCLKNGINVLFVNKTTSELVLIGFVCKTGYVDEFKNFPNGISTMIERLFLKGTHKSPSTKKIWEASAWPVPAPAARPVAPAGR